MLGAAYKFFIPELGWIEELVFFKDFPVEPDIPRVEDGAHVAFD